MSENKTKILDKKDVSHSAFLYMMFHHCAQNYERMMGLAFCHCLAKPLKKLYPDKEEYTKALQRHMQYYNTEPTLGAIIPGITLSLEEGRAMGEPVDEEMIVSTKNALMGPFAGIGDSLVGSVYQTIIASIAIGLSATTGSLIGPAVLLIFYSAVCVCLKLGLFQVGYKMGVNALHLLTGKVTEIATVALSIVGLVTVGGVAANTVNVPLALTYTSGELTVEIGSIINNIMPGLLPLCLCLGIWQLYTRKHWSTVKALVVCIAVVYVCVLLGIM